MQFNREFICRILSDVSFLSHYFPTKISFSTNSKALKKDDIFIAVQGEKVDGHEFIDDAFNSGAAGIILEKNKKSYIEKYDNTFLKQKFIMLVADPKQAIIDLAVAWRKQFSYPVVAVTGSVGKTSTKETISILLDEHKASYVASYGTQNTQIGLAMNMLKMRSDHEAAIFELGINRRGEMARLAEMARPTIGVITNVGHSHMEGLGSVADIASEKRDIFKFFEEDNIGIVNGDQPLLANVAYHHPIIKVGSKTTNQIQARKITIGSKHATFVMKLYGKKYSVTLQKNHIGAVFNALCAVAVGYLLKIPDETIIRAIEKPLVISGRFEQRKLKIGKGYVINDAYNANPESMKAALATLQHIKTDAHKIAVLGDMLELGANSPFWHRQLGRFLRKVPSVQDVILVGSLVEWTKKTLPVNVNARVVADWKEAEELVRDALKGESMILVKGSRGIGLNRLVESIS